MEKAIIITDMGKSLVIPPVTVHIPMPQGAGTPADIAHCPGVGAPPSGLQLVDDLHGSHLWGARHRARGEAGR